MKLRIVITFLLLCPLPGFSQANVRGPGKKGILVLGSANIETLRSRVAIALKQYHELPDLGYIIVSGGCNAHGSGICEATEMANILLEKGVPEDLIHKEEKSQSTVGNYCYSRQLKGADGLNVMQPGDSVYVISNHWHAFSVAGCLIDNDSIQAIYHIEGSIRPAENYTLDYGNLYKNCTQVKDYCETVLNPSR